MPAARKRACSSGADALNIRVHVPGVDAASVHAQTERLGTEVLPDVRKALAGEAHVT
jgi:hypothetical protein